jgi:Cft2 family RNA processing exonuclease
VDRIETLPYGCSREFDLGFGEKVSITALDANHCPGSAM